MEDTGHEDQGAPQTAKAPRPAWVDEQRQPGDDPWPGRPKRERLPRVPVPGKQEDDGLWTHVIETGGILVAAAWLAARFTAPGWTWPLVMLIAVTTAVTAYITLDKTA